jgi:hypothetical protein
LFHVPIGLELVPSTTQSHNSDWPIFLGYLTQSSIYPSITYQLHNPLYVNSLDGGKKFPQNISKQPQDNAV